MASIGDVKVTLKVDAAELGVMLDYHKKCVENIEHAMQRLALGEPPSYGIKYRCTTKGTHDFGKEDM